MLVENVSHPARRAQRFLLVLGIIVNCTVYVVVCAAVNGVGVLVVWKETFR
jgi:hypothetical protein